MSKNKTENAVIKSLILLHLSKKLLRCEKVWKLKWHFLDVFYSSHGLQVDSWQMMVKGKGFAWRRRRGLHREEEGEMSGSSCLSFDKMTVWLFIANFLSITMLLRQTKETSQYGRSTSNYGICKEHHIWNMSIMPISLPYVLGSM